jgi:hypothetical protein
VDVPGKTRAEIRAEIAGLCLDVIARSNATKQSTLSVSKHQSWIASLTLAMTLWVSWLFEI